MLVLAVLLLVGASYPLQRSCSVGMVAPSSGAAVQQPAGAVDRPHGGATSTKAPTTLTPTALALTEEASAVLAKLKVRTGQTGSNGREAPVQLPKRIAIPAIGVDAAFEYVALTAEGAMDVPKDPDKVAWYRLGPRPGEQGNAVVAGHVDWGGKTAVFWKLGDLKPGDVVELVAADERRYQFIVQWQRWYDADKAPIAQLFAQGNSAELTMITCGGVFDHKTRQYLSRLVVRAVRR